MADSSYKKFFLAFLAFIFLAGCAHLQLEGIGGEGCWGEIREIAQNGERDSNNIWERIFRNDEVQASFYYSENDKSIGMVFAEREGSSIGIAWIPGEKDCLVVRLPYAFRIGKDEGIKMAQRLLDKAKEVFPEISGLERKV